jgi:hypothetical protein
LSVVVRIPLSSHTAARSRGTLFDRKPTSQTRQRQALRERPRKDLETLRTNRNAKPQSQVGTSRTRDNASYALSRLGRCLVEVTTEAAVATAEGQGDTCPQERVDKPSM